MKFKVNVCVIVDYMLANNMSRKDFCDKCEIFSSELENLLQTGYASLLTILIISKATGLDEYQLRYATPYIINYTK